VPLTLGGVGRGSGSLTHALGYARCSPSSGRRFGRLPRCGGGLGLATLPAAFVHVDDRPALPAMIADPAGQLLAAALLRGRFGLIPRLPPFSGADRLVCGRRGLESPDARLRSQGGFDIVTFRHPRDIHH